MNPYGQGGYVIIDLRRMTAATATTTDLITMDPITTARTREVVLLTEIPTTIHTMIPTISPTSQDTTTTGRATTLITTTIAVLMIAALA